MQNWFTTFVKYQKQTEEGLLKSVTEQYLVDAVSFTEAEARITEIIAPEITGEFQITKINQTNFSEVINYDDSEGFYKAKVCYRSIDENGGKEKSISTMILVSANSLNEATQRVEESLETMLVPYKIPSVTETKIIDVFHSVSGL